MNQKKTENKCERCGKKMVVKKGTTMYGIYLQFPLQKKFKKNLFVFCTRCFPIKERHEA